MRTHFGTLAAQTLPVFALGSAQLAASPVSSMELKLSECVFFAAWEPHDDSSSHVWWTINSAQVAAAMGERQRET